MRVLLSILLGVVLFPAGHQPVAAAEEVVVRLSAKPDTVWIGEKVVLLLDILGKDGWAQLARADVHEIEGGFLKRFETQGTRLQERIDGNDYSGQQYEYLFFPQRAGRRIIEPVSIDVEIKRWGGGVEDMTMTTFTPSIELDVRTPPGVDSGTTIISTSDFSATQKWEPDQTEVSVGDAVTRTITLEAKNLSGMVFPPIEPETITDTGIYSASPSVEDHYSRGDLSGKRTERITYAMEKEGQVDADDIVYHWWNTATQKEETVILNGRTFSVNPLPVSYSDAGAAGRPDKGWYTDFLPIIATIFPALVLLLILRKPTVRWYRAWQEGRNTTEKAYFKSVARAARNKDSILLLNRAIQWLDRLPTADSPSRIDQFLSIYGEPGSQQTYIIFCKGIGSVDREVSNQEFYNVLAQARSNWMRISRSRKKIDRILPPLGIG